MTAIICTIAIVVAPAHDCSVGARGGHADVLPARGGKAAAVLEPIGSIDNWVCIHGHEGAWNDPDDPYWGGLQMDRAFMEAWGPDMVRKYGGWADRWSPRDQMVVAQRAYEVRGYTPWPNTARMCGLL